MSTPTIGVMPAGTARMFGPDLRSLLALARVAEAVGFDEFLLGDHLVMGGRLDRYPYGEFGYGRDLPPIGPDEPWPEVLTTLAAVAAVTTRIRLIPGVVLAPLRPAALLAKTVSTIDVLSGGRIELGVGVGWQREEYEALGVPFDRRWHHTEDTIGACRALWRDAPASFESPTVSFRQVHCSPRPVQPHIRVWLGCGASMTAARRVARVADGWFPLTRDVGEIRAGLSRIRDACEEIGRDARAIGVRIPATIWAQRGRLDAGRIVDEAGALCDAGATALWYALTPASNVRDLHSAEALLAELVTALGTAPRTTSID